MESPLSSRRLARSQTSITNDNDNDNNIPQSRKMEDSENGVSKSRNGKKERNRALINITNDSPIVGLAAGNMETPLSSMSKHRTNRAKNTPGSGEALLRGQVKTLLQMVDEDAKFSKPSLNGGRPILQLKGFINSPMGLLAPTPANTPQITNISVDETVQDSGLAAITSFLRAQNQSQVRETIDLKKEEEPEKDIVTRSLLFDFFEKSDSSECSSEVTYQGATAQSEHQENQSADNDDDDSIWSIQVNASSTHNEDEVELTENEEEHEEHYYNNDEEEEEEDGGVVDSLCEGISNMSMTGTKNAKFEGKHIRFVYNNSDDDEYIIKGEEEGENLDLSPSVLRLKGLPTPKGKHMRFALADEETEN